MTDHPGPSGFAGQLLRSCLVAPAVFGASALLALAGHAHAQQMPRMELTAGFYRIETEVAATLADRMQGLMQRQQLPQNQGMLFVFPELARHCMWMRNTPLPLSVAFLDDSGRIINVEDMVPHSEASHCAAAPARFALEMNRGWFAERRLARGQRIVGVADAPRPQ